MQQIAQKLKTGQMQVIEVPIPSLQKGWHLVKNHYSLISTGSEGSTVKTARKGYIGKAKERPQQVKQVIDVLKSQGPVQTYRAVMKKLDSYSPLGYSCADEVIDMAPDVRDFFVRDFVGCGGLCVEKTRENKGPKAAAVLLQKKGSRLAVLTVCNR